MNKKNCKQADNNGGQADKMTSLGQETETTKSLNAVADLQIERFPLINRRQIVTWKLV